MDSEQYISNAISYERFIEFSLSNDPNENQMEINKKDRKK